MSYDVSIGGRDFNCTFNVSKLFYDHIPDVRSRGGLDELDGLTGKQAAEVISEAFDRIEQTRHKFWLVDAVGEPEFCARYDAKNGWGSAVGGIIFLAQILSACAANPRKKVSVSA